jgi:hypothetical protein
MSLRFPYQPVPMNHPVFPLGGRFSRPRPLLNVSVLGPAGAKVVRALLDTGADDTVFSDSLAAVIGLDLSNAPSHTFSGVGVVPYTVRYALVTLRLTDGIEYREWPAWVGFTVAVMKQPLLGFAGFLQFFTATFHGDREQVELTVNPLYPGQ